MVKSRLRKWSFILPIAIFLFLISMGAIIRLNLYLNYEFSYDERFSYVEASSNSFKNLIFFPTDDRPPLYYSLVKLLISISDNMYFLRFPSFLFSIITLILIYKIFLIFNTKSAQVALLLSSLHPLLISASWQARDYSLLQMLCVLVVFMLIKILNKIHQIKPIAAQDVGTLIVSIALGFLTSFLFYPFILITFSVFLCIVISLQNKIPSTTQNRRSLFFLTSIIFVIFLLAGIFSLRMAELVVSRSSLLEAPFNLQSLTISTYQLFSASGLNLYSEKDHLPLVLILFILVVPLISLTRLLKKELSIHTSFSIMMMSSGLSLFIFHLVISETTQMNLLVPKGFSTLVVYYLGYFFISFNQLNAISIKNTSLKLGYLILFLAVFSSAYYLKMIYFSNYNYWANLMKWEYPLIQEQLMTKVVKNITDLTGSDQLIFYPSWDDRILKFEWRREPQLLSRMKLHEDFWDLDKNILFGSVNKKYGLNLQRKLFFPDQYVGQESTFFLVMNEFVLEKTKEQTLKEDTDFYLKPHDLLSQYCIENVTPPEIKGSYSLLKCYNSK